MEEDNIQTGIPPNDNEKFYIEWAKESAKSYYSFICEVLKQQINISALMLGVSLVFEKIFNENEKIKFIIALFFFLSLITSFLGIIPKSRNKVLIISPYEIKKYKELTIKRTYLFMKISTYFISFGFGLIVIKLFYLAFIK